MTAGDDSNTASNPVAIGFLGIGLDTYWLQFEGLDARLGKYIADVAERLDRPGVKVVNAGLVDTVDKAFDTSRLFGSSDVDIIFLYVTTYALSSVVLPVVRRARVPVVVLNLQPGKAIDYVRVNRMEDRAAMTGEWLAWCSSCPSPEIANVLKRAGIPYFEIVGNLEKDDVCWREIDRWVEAARIVHLLAFNRCGLLGHYYNGMLDIYTDITRLQAAFGGYFDVLEIDELAEIRRSATEDSIRERQADFASQFDFHGEIRADELASAAATSVALDQLVERHKLGSLAYYYESTAGHEHQEIVSSIILGSSMLIERGIPVAGEYDVKNALAMKIMDSLGAGGSFTEYYSIDFSDDIVLMGHDGPGHIGIAQGKTRVRPLQVYHGKPSKGLSVEMSIAHGPVTLLSVAENSDGSFILLYAEGESVAGPILEIGNTNSRYRFSISARDFVEIWNSHGPAHHCAVGVGHIGDQLKKIAMLAGVDAVEVCGARDV